MAVRAPGRSAAGARGRRSDLKNCKFEVNGDTYLAHRSRPTSASQILEAVVNSQTKMCSAVVSRAAGRLERPGCRARSTVCANELG